MRHGAVVALLLAGTAGRAAAVNLTQMEGVQQASFALLQVTDVLTATESVDASQYFEAIEDPLLNLVMPILLNVVIDIISDPINDGVGSALSKMVGDIMAEALAPIVWPGGSDYDPNPPPKVGAPVPPKDFGKEKSDMPVDDASFIEMPLPLLPQQQQPLRRVQGAASGSLGTPGAGDAVAAGRRELLMQLLELGSTHAAAGSAGSGDGAGDDDEEKEEGGGDDEFEDVDGLFGREAPPPQHQGTRPRHDVASVNGGQVLKGDIDAYTRRQREAEDAAWAGATTIFEEGGHWASVALPVMEAAGDDDAVAAAAVGSAAEAEARGGRSRSNPADDSSTGRFRAAAGEVVAEAEGATVVDAADDEEENSDEEEDEPIAVGAAAPPLPPPPAFIESGVWLWGAAAAGSDSSAAVSKCSSAKDERACNMLDRPTTAGPCSWCSKVKGGSVVGACVDCQVKVVKEMKGKGFTCSRAEAACAALQPPILMRRQPLNGTEEAADKKKRGFFDTPTDTPPLAPPPKSPPPQNEAATRLAKTLLDDTASPLKRLLHRQVTPMLRKRIRDKLVRGVLRESASDITLKVAHRLTNHLSKALRATVHNVASKRLRKSVTEALTLTLVPSISASLVHDPVMDYVCYYCREKQVYCEPCTAGQASDVQHAQTTWRQAEEAAVRAVRAAIAPGVDEEAAAWQQASIDTYASATGGKKPKKGKSPLPPATWVPA